MSDEHIPGQDVDDGCPPDDKCLICQYPLTGRATTLDALTTAELVELSLDVTDHLEQLASEQFLFNDLDAAVKAAMGTRLAAAEFGRQIDEGAYPNDKQR